MELSNIMMKQSSAEKFATKTKVELINKSLHKDGKKPIKNLGKDQFLKMLVTELKNQDPTNPMKDREFIAQMAQFSSLEQMLNMNNNMAKFIENSSFQSSFNLLGFNVELSAPDKFSQDGNEQLVTGKVEAVSRKNGETFITVNGEEYPLTSVIKVDIPN